MALGYVLHHELAHLRLGHSGSDGTDSIRQENDADQAAAEWILGGIDELDARSGSGDRFTKRALGIAIGLSWIASLDVYILKESSTHPPAYDRLYQVLEQNIEDDNHPVWAMVSIILRLHIQNHKLPYDGERKFQSFKDAVNYHVNLIAG